MNATKVFSCLNAFLLVCVISYIFMATKSCTNFKQRVTSTRCWCDIDCAGNEQCASVGRCTRKHG